MPPEERPRVVEADVAGALATGGRVLSAVPLGPDLRIAQQLNCEETEAQRGQELAYPGSALPSGCRTPWPPLALTRALPPQWHLILGGAVLLTALRPAAPGPAPSPQEA